MKLKTLSESADDYMDLLIEYLKENGINVNPGMRYPEDTLYIQLSNPKPGPGLIQATIDSSGQLKGAIRSNPHLAKMAANYHALEFFGSHGPFIFLEINDDGSAKIEWRVTNQDTSAARWKVIQKETMKTNMHEPDSFEKILGFIKNNPT